MIANSSPEFMNLLTSLDGFKWVAQEIGDSIYSSNPPLAFSIYLKAKVHGSAIRVMLAKRQFQKIRIYARKVQYDLDFPRLLQQIFKKDKEVVYQFSLWIVVNYSPRILI